MKKKFFTYLGLTIISLFVGYSHVSASGSIYISNLYSNYEVYTTYSSSYSTAIANLKTYWQTNWSTLAPNYIIIGDSNSITLQAYNTTEFYYYDTSGLFPNNGESSYRYSYNISNDSYSTTSSFTFMKVLIYDANFTLKFVDSHHCSASISSRCADVVQYPSYSNIALDVSYPQINIENNDDIPTYMTLTNGSPSADFTQVDMSQYDYIILSLRDYDTSSFNTTIYSLGRLCFTPVYDYGMTPKSNYMTGYQTQACTEYYTTSTPVSIYIIESDLEYHAVYYIKRYENETNILQIPTSIFDITYITSANANDPQVIIGGRSYPTIKYSDLTDTANISTDTGYISGQVCALGDINCASTVTGFDISDLWTSPLQLFKTVGNSITSVLGVITAFITFLPPTLQAFLYTAFFLVIILGIIKVLL